MNQDAIEFESTPNPNALRIVTGFPLTHGASQQFKRGIPASNPLAADLLEISGLIRVMIARNFVTIVRETESISWDSLRPSIKIALSRAASAEVEDLSGASPEIETIATIERQIEDVLARYVNPLLAADGGEALLVSFDPQSGLALVKMEGACGGCPSGAITLKGGIEQAIRHWVPEVRKVEALSDDRPREDPRIRFRKWIEARWGKVE
ncbi:NifU family protein [Sphingopyxis sp. SE2]|uniref:NifU family protein n=1 Tax=Sphingopyxis sp. SE2 TaxID=1586240 RepID=UPI0028C00E3D|nr:NifU family protein [Sphingopyxis sp. SE2]MDT7527766.1 NifU family protein [Sphingopyxis sp. SE2]